MNDDKPFRILGIQQIAIGGPSKDKLKALWVDMLGLTVKSTFVSERENCQNSSCWKQRAISRRRQSKWKLLLGGRKVGAFSTFPSSSLRFCVQVLR